MGNYRKMDEIYWKIYFLYVCIFVVYFAVFFINLYIPYIPYISLKGPLTLSPNGGCMYMHFYLKHLHVYANCQDLK